MTDLVAQIRLPYVEKIHEVINAYFRTSIQGEWELDTALRPDPFIVRYRRGARSWMAGLGLRGNWTEYQCVYPSVLAQGKGKFPVLLKIVIRPSPSATQLSLHFSCRAAYDAGRKAEFVAADQKRIDEWLAEIASGDSQGLVDYLFEFYSLQEKPELIVPITQ